MSRWTVILPVVSALLATSGCLAATALPFAAAGYHAVPLPRECIPERVGDRIKDVSQFLTFSEREAFQTRGNTVPRFIELFGLPDEYRTKKHRERADSDYLIYRLSGGDVVYVHASGAPHCVFGAAVAVDRTGKLLRLVK